MIRRPPRATRTDTLFPYTTLFRAHAARDDLAREGSIDRDAIERAAAAASGRHLLLRETQRDACFCGRSAAHTSELQSLMRISYAVFCLKKKSMHIYLSIISPSSIKPSSNLANLHLFAITSIL